MDELLNPLKKVGSCHIFKNYHLLNYYDENFYYAQDYKLFSDLLNSGYSFKHIKTPLYVLNMKDNISSDFNKQQDYYANCVRKNKLPDK